MFMTLPDHKCYMEPLQFSAEEAEKHRNAKFIFFDFETYVAENKELVPNLAVRFSLFSRKSRNPVVYTLFYFDYQVAQYCSGEEYIFSTLTVEMSQSSFVTSFSKRNTRDISLSPTIFE